MKKAYILILLFVSSPGLFALEDFEMIFRGNYRQAVATVRSKSSEYSEILLRYGGDPELLIPIVFPEIVRFNLMSHNVEVTGLKLFYVNGGKDYANFSVGQFQMKPSFIEKMEVYVKENNTHSLFKKLSFIYQYPKGKNISEQREIRVNRLDDIEWQLKYLACFGAIVAHKFKNVKFKNTSEKIEFYSAVYNRGIQFEIDEIKSSMKRPFFPHGARYPGKQYHYHKVASHFYEKHWRGMWEEFLYYNR